MATRSIVSAHTEKGVRGVYVHWDGYPSARVPILEHLIARDGVGKVVATIIGKPNGWSNLDPNQTSELDPLYRDGRFMDVAGYGVEYAPAPIQGNEYYWTPDSTDDMGTEYIYLITEDGRVEYASAGDDYALNRLFAKPAA